MKKRMAALAALLALSLPLSGCWNYREVEQLCIVAGVAVDSGQDGHKYHLTIDIADTSSAGKEKPVETNLIECDGDTLFEAIRAATNRNAMKLYWPNCQIIVVSREVASESILPIVDFFIRDAEPRLTIEMLVSEEKTAKEILEAKQASLSIKSFEIDKIYEQNEKLKPVAPYLLLYEINNMLASEGSQLTLPSLRHAQNGEDTVCEISGMSLFRKDRLTASLSREDSLYAMYAMDRVSGGILTVKAPTGNDIASLEVFKSKTTVLPVVENGAIRYLIHTETDVALGELAERADVTSKELMNEFEAAAEMQLQKEIERVVKMIQEQYALDIFGFGEALHKSDTQTWHRVRETWDEVFRTLPVEVSSKINFRNAAQRIGPVKVGG